jgi:hypothetical protein
MRGALGASFFCPRPQGEGESDAAIAPFSYAIAPTLWPGLSEPPEPDKLPSAPAPDRRLYCREASAEPGGSLPRLRAAHHAADALLHRRRSQRLLARTNLHFSAQPSTSLRAKRSNPALRRKDWIASAFALRASADAVVAKAPRNEVERLHNHRTPLRPDLSTSLPAY